MNSKKVKLVPIDRSRTPKDVLLSSTKKLGSVHTRNGDVLRALTLDEEKYYLPDIVGISANDPNFAKATKTFWIDFSITIELELQSDGLELEIGGQLGDNGFFEPLNKMNWIMYKFCQKHPRAATTKEEIDSKDNSSFQFYIKDDVSIKGQRVLDLEVKEKADRLYLQLFIKPKDGELDLKKLDWIIDNYRIKKDTDGIEDTTDLSGKKLFLYTKKEGNPQRFIDILSDELIREKAMILEFMRKGLLQQIGNTIVDDQQPIGGSYEEAAIYLKDPKNSKFLLSLNERAKAITV